MSYKITKLSDSEKVLDKVEFVERLQERLEKFADGIIELCGHLPKNDINKVIVSQLTRAGCSVGANYIEANESLGRKDFYHKIRISRKEAKESGFWLRRLIGANPEFKDKAFILINESREFVLIFSKTLTHS